MALQKRNALLRAHLVVTLFWFLVLFVVLNGFNIKLLAASMSYAILVAVGGLVCGVALWAAVDMSRRNGALSKGGAHSLRGARSTIGALPVAQEPKRGSASESMLASRFSWWAGYRARHPAHAEAFRAILAVMASTPKLPASPVPGGHGGATLIEHSFNVVNTMMQMAPKWVYKGHRNKKGDIAFPLLDTTRTEFRFAQDDPILPLAAFAHDIGKISCYKISEDGSVREIRKNHDVEGAKLLRALPEIMALSWKDRVAILTACEFYHHLGSIPYSTWIDDRARALIELLIAADIATGQREGGVMANEYEDSDLVLPQTDEGGDPEASDAADPEISEDVPETQRASQVDEAMHGSALDLTYSVLLEPGRVNGANAASRVAWKHGEWLYINDARLRGAVARKTGDSGYNNLPHRGNMHGFTLELMAQLSEMGALLKEHNGRKFSEKRAIYTTRSAVPGKTSIESKFVIVAKASAFPGLENAADCKTAPEIVECSWGETAAVNKSERSGVEGSVDAVDLPLLYDDVSSVPDAVEFLLDAAASMALPHVEKTVDGETFLFFEEEVVKQEYPELPLEDERFIRKTGGNSGKIFIGIGKATGKEND